MPVGTRLKQVREAKGLSLETIHDAIKVPIDALRAIEEGYKVRTLSPFYYQGFVKIYGQYLGVDVSDAMKSGKKESPAKSLEQEYKQFFIRDMLSTLVTTRRLQQALVILFGLLLLFGLFKTIQFVFHRSFDKKDKKVMRVMNSQRTQTQAAKPVPKVRVVAKPKPIPKPVAKPKPASASKPAKPSKPAAVSKPAVSKNVTLVVRAKKDSWLRVKQDGTVVFQSPLPRGSVETWLADQEIEISGKNITQLEFELNGTMIDPLGRKNRKAKSLIFTKDGLKIRM